MEVTETDKAGLVGFFASAKSHGKHLRPYLTQPSVETLSVAVVDICGGGNPSKYQFTFQKSRQESKNRLRIRLRHSLHTYLHFLFFREKVLSLNKVKHVRQRGLTILNTRLFQQTQMWDLNAAPVPPTRQKTKHLVVKKKLFSTTCRIEGIIHVHTTDDRALLKCQAGIFQRFDDSNELVNHFFGN